MNRLVAVERDLTPVMEYLAEKGYFVEPMSIGNEFGKNIKKYDAIVITGMNKDFLGMQDMAADIPVIEAKGLSAEQVYNMLKSRLH